MDYQQTVNQLGGFGRLQAMVGAYNFLKSDTEQFLSFRFKGSKKANYIKIHLNGLDLYDVEIGKIKKIDYEKTYEIEGVYAEDLKRIFEDQTGLYLSL